MQGEVLQWNPDAPPTMVQSWLNNAYRRIVDHRLWYGLLVRGQVVVPTVYSTGTATFTLGSPTVTGVGTAWTTSMVGMQIRAGYTTGWQNIQAVNPTTQTITLDLPWGNQNSTTGYQIVQTWVSLGPNIKMVLDMVNQRQGWRLGVNIPQQAINQWDTWRTTTGWTQMLCNKEPNAAGWPMFELWPAPTFQQTFPFLAYTQPPDMVQDADFPLTFIRSDIIILGAIKDALLFRGGNNGSRYYNPTVAQQKEKEFHGEIFNMDNMDDGQYAGKTLSWDYSRWPMSQYGANFMQSHAGGPSEWP
jgi:hypothetical protein